MSRLTSDESMRAYLEQFSREEIINRYISMNNEFSPYRNVRDRVKAVNDAMNYNIPWAKYPDEKTAKLLADINKLKVLMSFIDKDEQLREMYDTMLLHIMMTE